jgi:hypothetical protein
LSGNKPKKLKNALKSMLSGLEKGQVEGFWKELVFRIRARIVPSGLEFRIIVRKDHPVFGLNGLFLCLFFSS